MVMLYLLGFFGLMAGILFAAAGTFNLPMFWAYIAVMLVLSGLGYLWVSRHDPDLIKERLHPGPGERDRLSISLLYVTLAVHWGIAGLDVGRFHWSGHMPMAMQIAGLIGFALGIGLSIWPMLINPFFSSAVRLQLDRGQYVITTGPYRYVRHPGYSGGLLFLLCSGPALGSWWSMLPMLLAAGGLVRRTRLEDRMLQEELPGYAGYAQRVRYRLIPGLW